MIWYALLIAAVAVERIAELVVSQRNLAWSRARGGVEFGAGPLSGDGRPAHRLAGGMPGGGDRCTARSCPRWAGRCWRSCSPRRRCAGGASPRWATNGTPASSSSPTRRGSPAARTGSSRTPTTWRSSSRASRCRWCTRRGSPRWCSRCSTPRCCDADQGRERRTGEAAVIDLLVAGGGPAGLATAIHGARAGLEVVVVERRRGPVDKACGEGLMPHAVAQLDRLGVRRAGQAVARHHLRRRRAPRHRAIPRRRRPRRAQDGPARRAAGGGRRRQASRFVHGEVGDGHARTRRRCAAASFAPATWPPPTGCTRRSAPRSAWPCRRRARVGGASAVTSRSRRGPTASRCTGPRDAEAYVTPVADDCVGIAILSVAQGRLRRAPRRPFPRCRIGCAVTRTALTGRRARCGRGCAAERRAGCCWSVTPRAMSTR